MAHRSRRVAGGLVPLMAGWLLLAGLMLSGLTLAGFVAPNAQADTISDTNDQLAKLQDEQADLALQAGDLQDKLSAAQDQLGATNAQIQAEQATIAQLRPQIAQIALQQFQDAGLSTTAALLTSANADEWLNQMAAIQQVNDTAVMLLQTLQLSQGRLSDLQTSQQATVDAISADQAALTQTQSDLTAKVAEVTATLNQLLRAASTVPAAGNIGAVDPATAVPNPSGHLINPVPGAKLTSPFGSRTDPVYGGREFHTGLDLAIGCGTPIAAAANGLVISAGWGGGYGNRVVLENGIIAGHHIVTTYNHMTEWAVSPGDNVAQGQVIGYVGATGKATGCHLHFEVLADSQFTDPALYIF